MQPGQLIQFSRGTWDSREQVLKSQVVLNYSGERRATISFS